MGKILASGVISSSLAPNCLFCLSYSRQGPWPLLLECLPPPWHGKGVAKLFLSESWYHTSMCGREQFQFFPQLEAIATISVLAGQSLIGKKCVVQWESFERLLERAAHLNVDSPPGGSGLKQAIVHSVIFGYKYDWIPVNTCEYL